MRNLAILARSTITLLLVARCCLAATANESVFESGPTRIHLLELFTSEGCSSCPPAEAWIGQLKKESGLWRDFVPVAFHVDYWDHLGWRDRFASKEWTARQQAYATRWNASSVYTPGFVLDGSESRAQLPRPSPESVGTLRLKTNDGVVVMSFAPGKAEARDHDVYLAGLGFDLSSVVAAGENSGRKLSHDFVVLTLQKAVLSANSPEVTFKIDKSGPNKIGALAAWITPVNDPTPIQATGGWLSK